jgi:hypothetical protein
VPRGAGPPDLLHEVVEVASPSIAGSCSARRARHADRPDGRDVMSLRAEDGPGGAIAPTDPAPHAARRACARSDAQCGCAGGAVRAALRIGGAMGGGQDNRQEAAKACVRIRQ